MKWFFDKRTAQLVAPDEHIRTSIGEWVGPFATAEEAEDKRLAALREMLTYGDECVLTLTNGRQLRTDTYENAPEGATYVRVLDAEGNEVAYWDSKEWEEDPKLVMGAIFGAAKGE